MAISGFGSGWAFAKETTFGTPVATTKAMPFLSETLTLDKAWVTSNTLKGGNFLPTTSGSRQGSRVGNGDVQTLLYTHGSAALTEAMLGGIATTGAGPFEHVATMAATLPSYSMQVSLGDTSGTLRKAVEGAKVASWEIAIAVNENVTLGLTWVYEDELLATASALEGAYPATLTTYNANDVGTLTIGGVEYCVEQLTISGDNGLVTDSFCIGQTTISDPVAQRRTITGSMVVKVDAGSTALYDAYIAGTGVDIQAVATIGASTFTVDASAFLMGTSPTIAGEEEITVTIPWEVRASTTDAAAFSLTTVNSDATP